MKQYVLYVEKFTKIISALLIMVISSTNMVCADYEVSDSNVLSERIAFDCKYISERFYEDTNIDCIPIDIHNQTNRGFSDEVADDGLGGWTDQGSQNDMSSFDLYGNQSFFRIPFNVINPNTNNGTSCIVLRGQNNENFPLSVEVPIDDYGYGIYLLHSTAWGRDGERAGTYTYIYEDGTSAYFDVVGQLHISDFWQTVNNDYTKVIWEGNNATGQHITLNIFPLINPHPEKKISKIRFESEGTVQYINIVAVTLAKEIPIFPLIGSKDSEKTLLKSGTESWTKYNYPDESQINTSTLDASRFLDAPAGKHGHVVSNGSELKFTDGVKAKFWGTNLVGEACFPTKEKADLIVSRVSRCGYNLVRFVNFSQCELTDDNLDKLSYLLSELKKRGIYVYFSFLGNENDVENKGIRAMLSDDILDEQCAYAQKLLSYNNPYTNSIIADDPMVAMIDCGDQSSIFDLRFDDSVFSLNDDYTLKLQDMFNDYLKNKYKSTASLKKSWSDLLPNESIENSTVRINGNWKYGIYDEQHKRDVYEFLKYLQINYYKKFKSCLENIGYKGLMTSFTNSWDTVTPENSISNSETDFIPYNAIFSYGYDWKNSWPFALNLRDNLVYLDTDSTVKTRGYDGKILKNVFNNVVSSKPFVITEWGAAAINPNFVENSILMAAISGQQNWTPIQYCFIQDDIDMEGISSLYETYNNPASLAISYASAALFYTMDELDSSKVINKSIKDVLNNKYYNEDIWFSMKNKTMVNFLNKSHYNTNKSIKTTNGFIIDNGGIYWDLLDGAFFAKTDKAFAFSGKISREEITDIVDFDIYDIGTTFSLVSLNDEDLPDSNHMLLTLVGDVTNKGTSYTSKYVINKIGNDGVVYKTFSGSFTLKTKNDISVYELDNNGNRVSMVDVSTTKDGYKQFFIGSNGTGDLHYEIIGGKMQ